MTRPRLPRRLVLPSGLVVQLEARDAPEARRDAPGAPRFSAARDLLASGAVRVLVDGRAHETSALALGDFHVLRALLLRSGFLAEDEVAFPCRNCKAEIRAEPCAALEIGPWVDGELDDEELDATAPFGEPIPIHSVPLGRVRRATTLTLAARTVGDAEPFFQALGREPLELTGDVVRAMGIVAVGPEHDAAKIAEALGDADDDAFDDVADAWLAAHYAPRLAAVVPCPACGARNDADAPWERELAPGAAHARAAGREEPFPDFDAFAARAEAIAAPLLDAAAGDPVSLVVVDRPADVDDGGEPLLGSYVPAWPGDAHTAPAPPTVTIYFRTFEAMWNEDGPYDWDAELAETIEHELLHHTYHLQGDDPMDDEERAEIAREGLRVVGRREAKRRAVQGLGRDFGEFVRRTWPLWIIAVVAAILGLLGTR